MGLEVGEVNRYILKSAHVIRHNSVEVDDRGIYLDHYLMGAKAKDRYFLSQRTTPLLATIQPYDQDDFIKLYSAKTGEIVIPKAFDGERVTITTQIDKVDGIKYYDEANEWFSDTIGLNAFLAHFPDSYVRRLDPEYDPGQTGQTTYTDGYPFLIANPSTLVIINQISASLDYPTTPMENFRPTLTIKGAKPFEEYEWRKILVGNSLEIDLPKPGGRCIITTTDQRTGIRNPHQHPFNTILMQYFKWNGKAIFGQNGIHRSSGTLYKGAPVTVLERGPGLDFPLAQDYLARLNKSTKI